MSAEEKIEKISKLSKVGSKSIESEIAAVEPPIERVPPNPEHFDRLMIDPSDRGHGKISSVASIEFEPTRPSLVQEVKNLDQKVGQISRGQVDDLVAAADDIVDKMHSIKTQLASSTDANDLPSSTRRLLTNRLGHIDENLKIALNKAGVEYVPPLSVEEKATPIQRFLGMLTNGQNQLESLTGQVQQMQMNGKELSPANMLLIQIKVGTVQQEIEFFTSMLNKGLESTKTLMNVQV